MKQYEITEVYDRLLECIAAHTKLCLHKLKHSRSYPESAYRFLVFGYLNALGYRHQDISRISGFARTTVTYGIAKANKYTDNSITVKFKRILKSYDTRRIQTLCGHLNQHIVCDD